MPVIDQLCLDNSGEVESIALKSVNMGVVRKKLYVEAKIMSPKKKDKKDKNPDHSDKQQHLF